MSTLVTICRPPGHPISIEQLRTIEGLVIAPRADMPSHEVLFSYEGEPPGEPFELLLTSGTLETLTTPTNATLQRLQVLAKKLDASLVDEGGQDLTEVSIPEMKTRPLTACGCVCLTLVLFSAAVWWLS